MKIIPILLLAMPCFAAGPKYSFDDPNLNDEFVNVYHDISNTLKTSSVTLRNVNVSSLTVTGTASIASLLGTANATAACVGCIGEIISSNITTNTSYPASGAYGDLTSISLTPGKYLLGMNIDCNNASGVTANSFEFGITSTSGNSGTGLTIMKNYIAPSVDIVTGKRDAWSLAGFNVSASVTTTYYLKYLTSYTGATAPFARGYLWATRIN